MEPMHIANMIFLLFILTQVTVENENCLINSSQLHRTKKFENICPLEDSNVNLTTHFPDRLFKCNLEGISWS